MERLQICNIDVKDKEMSYADRSAQSKRGRACNLFAVFTAMSAKFGAAIRTPQRPLRIKCMGAKLTLDAVF
jgi:hypothetical protein